MDRSSIRYALVRGIRVSLNVVPAKRGLDAEEALFREEGKMRMRMLSEKHCFVVSVTVGNRHQTFTFFFGESLLSKY